MTRQDNPRVHVPPPLIYSGLLVVGLWIESARAPATVQVLAMATGLGGLALIALALGLFRTRKTRPEPWQPATALVADGIYSRTRNPMYLGMAVLSLSIALFFSSIAAAILTLVAMVIIDLAVIRREEAYLIRRFGGEYAAYRTAVRRWF